MEILRDISIFWSFIHILVLFMILYEAKYTKKKNLIITLSAMLPLIIINGILFVLYGNEIMSKLMILTMSLPSLIFFLWMSKVKDGRFFFTFCLVDTLCYVIILSTSILDYYLGNNKYILMFITRLIIFPLLEILTYKFLRTKYLEIQSSKIRGWGICAIVSVLYYILLAYMTSYPTFIIERPDDIISLVLIFIIMPLSYYAIFRVLTWEKKLHIEVEQKLMMDKQIKVLENEIAVSKDYIEHARHNRHDMRHNISVILDYLKKNDVEGAKAYLAEYNDAIEDSAMVMYCENEIVNAIIRLNLRKCANENIKFTVNTVIPKNLPYTKTETATIFGNVLENAYEAAKECENGFVEIHSKFNDGILLIEIKNSVSKEVEFFEDFPVSSKPRGGIGVRSAKKCLNKYFGLIRLKQEGNIFITQIIQKIDDK